MAPAAAYTGPRVSWPTILAAYHLDANEISREAVRVCAWLGMQSTCYDCAWIGLEEAERGRTMAPNLAPKRR